jgi:N-acetylneuraminate synthase
MVFIIAELGTNHMGDVKNAKKLIDVAVSAGCNAVKLQKKNVEKIFAKEFLDSPLESPWGTTQRDMRLHREFNDNQFKQIRMHCKRKKIPWFVSCWDVESQIHMREFRTKFNKVASAMLVHEKLLETIAQEKKYTFMSTGMSSLKIIEKAVKIFRKYQCPFELMHCHSAYPMPPEEANLKLIPFLRKKFRCKVGYSGHESAATYVSLPAVLMGATSIERHITLNRSSYGTDQAASLEPKGLNTLVRDIRILEKIMGDGKKIVWKSEIPNQKKLRQILV